MSYPKIGNLAPAFTLKNQQGNRVSLKDFRGKASVLLYFYPRASTPGCTIQAAALRDAQEDFDKQNCVVLGVSPDEPEKLQRFTEKQSLNFDLLSDVDYLITQKYGAWGEKKSASGVKEGLLRTSFLISKDGRLQAVLEGFKVAEHHQLALDHLSGKLISEAPKKNVVKVKASKKNDGAKDKVKADIKLRVFPKLGNLAPDFSLLNQQGEVVSLKQFRGNKNIVLYFYPKAATPGCTVQACGLRDHRSELEKFDTVVLGVSPDPVKKLQRFIDKESLNFDLLSDEDHAIAEMYACWGMKQFMGRHFMGLIRTSFLIDKDGRLQAVLDKFKTKTHHEDVLECLSKLNFS